MSWFKKTDDEIIQRLKNVLKTEDFQFIGKFEEVPNKDFGFFKEVRSLSGVKKFYPKDDGSTDDQKLRPLEIFTKSYNQLIPSKWYKFYAVPASNPLRKDKKNPFLLQTDWKRVKDIVLLKGNELIDNIKNDALNTPEAIAGNLMRAIETISIDINTEPTTFIFELIQNADDYPNNENNVSILFQINDSNLIIKHNGSKFEVNNTVALCGVNEGDKREDKSKIGFKGIGFKSIFKDSNYAYIKSGDFSFRFDEAFWKSQGIEIFWHITPINTPFNEFKSILIEESNVNIIIKPKHQEILENYKKTFVSHFNDERILLFLRNVKSLIFDSAEEKFQISNISSRWKIFTENDVNIPEEETNELNRRINFPDKRIPVKFYGISSTEIGFAFKIKDNIVESIEDGCIYAYLPTKVNLGFSFIINGNFIPDASRTKIYDDLTWNCFLFEKAGELFLKQIIVLINEAFDIESIFEQIPIFSLITANKLDEDKKIFLGHFKKGFEKEILNQPFIPNNHNKLETLSNIIVDETGLSTLLNNDFFILKELNGNLIDNQFGKGVEKVKALLNEYNFASNIYTINELKTDLKKPKFQEWLKVPQNNFKIIQHFYANKILKGLLETEEIILTADNELNVAFDVYNTVPKTITFVEYKKINEELLNLLIQNKISLNLKEFDPVEFHKEKIWSKHVSINEKLDNEIDLINFWNFIYDNWNEFEKEDNIKTSLKLFSVLCKSLNEETLYKIKISAVYIAADFNPENEIESVIKEIGIQEAKFISEKYISEQRTAIKWYKIFKQALAITDLQKVIEVLLPNLSTIEESKHFEITKQIFKFWKENRNKETQLTESQLNLIRKNLKIKSSDNKYYNLNQAIISDHYQTNKVIQSILPLINLPNQISSEYGPRANQIVDWKNFFNLVNCIELSERQNVLDKKIAFFVENQDDLRDNHFEIVMQLSDLYKTKNENGLIFSEIISEIKLLTDKDDWSLPSDIHLSSNYKPKLDLQKDELVKENINFLNEKYIPNKIDKYFFGNLGVNSSFKVKKAELKRDQIPVEYLEIFEKKDSYITSNAVGYGSQHRIANHITINYPFLLTNLKYSILFWEELIKDNSKFLNYIFEISNYKMAFNKVVFNENYLIYFIKTNKTIPNQNEELKKPEDLFSFSLGKYLDGKSELTKYDFSKIYLNNNEDSKSLEDILGIKNQLSQEHCVEFLVRKENRISLEEIIELKIIDILKDFIPSENEKENIFLLNHIHEWKPIKELFYTTEEEFEIDPSHKLNDLFLPIAKSIGVQELSEDNYTLILSPNQHALQEDIKAFFESNAIFFGFKISESDYLELETEIISKICQYKFFQVIEIIKGFPESKPIYKKSFDFFIDAENNVYYKDFWKSNKDFINFLLCDILEGKVTKNWLSRVITGWSIKEIIEDLKVNSSIDIPNTIIGRIKENNIDNTSNQELDEVIDDDTFWSNLTTNDIDFIKGIILGDYELNEKLDANKTAKIKTLMKIRDKYNSDDLSDGDRFLKAGSNEILVRSAQNGLLYLDLFHWERLNETNVQLAIYTNNQIDIYDSQESLIKFTKPQNKFGILRMPVNYNVEDFNSLENIYDKGKWHYVFIVNENTKAAQNYKEFINLDDYNF